MGLSAFFADAQILARAFAYLLYLHQNSQQPQDGPA